MAFSVRGAGTVALAAALALLSLSCALVRPTASGSGSNAGGSGWTRHDDPSGFSLELPSGWRASKTGETGLVQVVGTGGERVDIQPFFTSRSLDAGTSRPLLASLGSKVRPHARWEQAAPAGAGGATRMAGTDGSDRLVAVLAWTVSPRGTAGDVYVAGTAAKRFSGEVATLARVMQSFRLRGPPANASARPRYATFTDPVERAFSMEVPEGWKVQGGTKRPSTAAVQGSVQATSPDGAIVVYAGDEFPIYSEPSALLAQGGIGRGGTYTFPDGYRSPVQPYAPGTSFLTGYLLPQRMGGGYQVLRNVDAAALASQLTTVAGVNRYDAGELEYGFTKGGQAYRGGALCITEEVTTPSGKLWHVWRLSMFEAPQAREAEAAAALVHMATSFQIDQKWAAAQARTTAQQSQILAKELADTSKSISDGYWGRQASLDDISRRRSNATLGVVDVVDPATGSSFKVENGSNYYWIDDRGSIVGTDTSTQPSVDFRQIVALP